MTNRSRLVILVLLGVGALALMAVIVRATLPEVFSAAPGMAERLAPGDPDIAYRLAALRYGKRPGRLPDATYRQMLDAARNAPLSADPFVIEATRAIADDDPRRATQLLEEARRRNPRQRLARALLLERYIRANRLAEAGTEVAVLNRLVPDANNVLVNGLAAMAKDKNATAAVGAALHGDKMLDELLANLVTSGADTAIVLRLARDWRPSPDANSTAWQSALLDRLVGEGQYALARKLWIDFGAPKQAASQTIFNSEFAQHAALPPFNWRLASNETGAAEITRRHVLSIEYFGRQTGELAGQLVMLPAGRYTLRTTAEGNANGQGSKLGWYVRCAVPGKPAEAGPVLLAAAIAGISNTPRKLLATFSVPATGCSAQWLTVTGVAAEFPTTQAAEFRDFSITRAGGD